MNRYYYVGKWPRNSVKYQEKYTEGTSFKRECHEKWYSLLVYEEEGYFYEFFTGHQLGKEIERSYDKRIFSDEFGYTFSTWTSYSYYDDNRSDLDLISVTAAEFAVKVKRNMPDKQLICVALEEAFEKTRQKHAADLKREEEKKAHEKYMKEMKEKEDAQNEKWLNDLFDGKK